MTNRLRVRYTLEDETVQRYLTTDVAVLDKEDDWELKSYKRRVTRAANRAIRGKHGKDARFKVSHIHTWRE